MTRKSPIKPLVFFVEFCRTVSLYVKFWNMGQSAFARCRKREYLLFFDARILSYDETGIFKSETPLSIVLFAIANCWRKAVLRRGGDGRVKYAPRTPNIIRAPEKILHSKRFLGKRKGRLIGQAVAVATVDEIALPWRGGAKGSRTPDLLNAIQTRYQLRYIPIASLL